jgi:hypothetical protein
MRDTRTTAVCLAATATAALALTGCGGGSGSASGSGAYKKTGVTRMLPDLGGMQLTDAQTAAGAAGFTHLVSSDAQGKKRSRSTGVWVVCSQRPASGSADTGVAVKLSVVRVSEPCPAGNSAGGGDSATPGSSHTYSHRPAYRSSRSGGSGGDDGSSSHSHSGSHSHHH